jgi:hypothetical protein
MKIRNESHAIDVLGGSEATGGMFRPRLDARVVSNWRSRGLPPKTWLVLAPRLEQLGFEFSPRLFGMLEPNRRASDGGKDPG